MKSLVSVLLIIFCLNYTKTAKADFGSEWDNLAKPGSIAESKNVLENDLYGIERRKNAQKIIDAVENKNMFSQAEFLLSSLAKEATFSGFKANMLIPVTPGLSVGAIMGFKIMHPRELNLLQRNAPFMSEYNAQILNKEASKTICNNPVLENDNYKFCTPQILSAWDGAANFAADNGGLWIKRVNGFKIGLGVDRVAIPIANTGVNILVGGSIKSDLLVETEIFYRNLTDLVTKGIYINLPSTPEKALKFDTGSIVRIHKFGSMKLELGASVGVAEYSPVYATLGALIGVEVNGLITTEFARKQSGFVELKTRLYDSKNFSGALVFSTGVKVPIGTLMPDAVSFPYSDAVKAIQISPEFQIIKLGIEKIITNDNLNSFEINLNEVKTHEAYTKAISGNNTELRKLAEKNQGVIIREDNQTNDSKVRGSFTVLGIGIMSESGVKQVKDDLRETSSKIFYENVTTNFIKQKRIESEGVLFTTKENPTRVFLNYTMGISRNSTAKELHRFLSLMYLTNRESYKKVPKQVFDKLKHAIAQVQNGNSELLSNGAIANLNFKYHLQLSEEELLDLSKNITYENIKKTYIAFTRNQYDNNVDNIVNSLMSIYSKLFSEMKNKETFAINISEALSDRHSLGEMAANVLFLMSKSEHKNIEFFVKY